MKPVARVSRRQLLVGAAGAAAACALDSSGRRLIEAAAATSCPKGSTLSDIEHVVILIQENRSFDHYFGSYRGVNGFDAHGAGGLGSFAQAYSTNTSRPPIGRLLPFHLDTQHTDAYCTNDLSHDWGPQHRYWNGGRNDSFVRVHEEIDGAGFGTITMGYFTRADLPFHYALADAFTICDHYHCSLFGPTYPNRLYSMSGTIDPSGRAGGPVITNPSTPFIYSWETMPERLQAAGVSWKVYSQADSNNNVLPFFKQYQDPTTPIAKNGLLPTWPADFQADVAGGNLPQVSWVLAPMDYDEHPPAPPEWGAWVQSQVLSTLVSNPQVWERTVLFIAYDENGGFFDHVPPPVAPHGTPDEYLTATPLPAEASGIAGPIGLGFRVPCLVVSPFSRSGLVCSDTFDHTSLLRFLERRFRVEAPNISAWRRSAVGDLTSALNLAASADPRVPALPAVSLSDPTTARECGPTLAQATGNELDGVGNVPPYPLPATQSMPRQEPGVARRASAAFSIVSAKIVRGHAVTVEVEVHTRGQLFARATFRSRLARARALYGEVSTQVADAGRVRITIRPRRQAIRLLRRARKLHLTVSLRFSPSNCTRPQTRRLEIDVRDPARARRSGSRLAGASVEQPGLPSPRER